MKRATFRKYSNTNAVKYDRVRDVQYKSRSCFVLSSYVEHSIDCYLKKISKVLQRFAIIRVQECRASKHCVNKLIIAVSRVPVAGHHMTANGGLLFGRELTIHALERFAWRMQEDVLLEVILVVASVGTDRTCKRFLAGVGEHVPLHVAGLAGPVRTQRAVLDLFSDPATRRWGSVKHVGAARRCHVRGGITPRWWASELLTAVRARCPHLWLARLRPLIEVVGWVCQGVHLRTTNSTV